LVLIKQPLEALEETLRVLRTRVKGRELGAVRRGEHEPACTRFVGNHDDPRLVDLEVAQVFAISGPIVEPDCGDGYRIAAEPA
jgi:hypothetical protein